MFITNSKTPYLLVLLVLTACNNDNETSAPETHLFYQDRAFDLEAHRGGSGLTTENTIESFSKALELGVTTLELDTQITTDGIAVVTHDRQVSDKKCLDTQPVTENDPLFPYVGKYINQLTLEQVKSLDCGTLINNSYGQQEQILGAQIPTLKEVLELVNSYKANNVMLNIETKVEAGAPEETAPRALFVTTVLKDIRQANLMNQTIIQSFDWGALMLVRDLEPSLPIIALTNGQQFLQEGVDGASPWLGGIDIDDFGGDLVAAVQSFNADAISPVQGDPQGGAITDVDFIPYTTRDLVNKAHAAQIKVIPWTVNDEATMAHFIDIGVDGLITDYPNTLRHVMASAGLPLPDAVAKP